jgi:hypothetical protein
MRNDPHTNQSRGEINHLSADFAEYEEMSEALRDWELQAARLRSSRLRPLNCADLVFDDDPRVLGLDAARVFSDQADETVDLFL